MLYIEVITLILTNIYSLGLHSYDCVQIKKYQYIFIKVVVTLFSAVPFLNEFSKECYRIAGVRESEVKLSIKLGLLKSDTNEF